MNFYIPSKGDKIRLLEDWSFRLFAEERNFEFIENILGSKKRQLFYELEKVDFNIKKLPFKPLIKVSPGSLKFRDIWGANGDYIIAVIPKGTILVVDGINIRKCKSDFDSIVFNVSKKVNPETDFFGTFCIKLLEANKLQFEKFIESKNIWVSSVEEEYSMFVNLLEI